MRTGILATNLRTKVKKSGAGFTKILNPHRPIVLLYNQSEEKECWIFKLISIDPCSISNDLRSQVKKSGFWILKLISIDPCSISNENLAKKKIKSKISHQFGSKDLDNSAIVH
ncbi:hypothetical protein BpHYR1_051103 [Brachionus plicatilis]|uniref:Uncharacterized protein n=1 Tax=Brachionus plicatilis TaxID=10195 RepID=A0A3M7S2Q5_BRAPC|nr:hypothetical protein BpHYR1_051103 [Brachionus plicatilis]